MLPKQRPAWRSKAHHRGSTPRPVAGRPHPHDRAARLGVVLDDLHGAAVGDRDGANLDLDRDLVDGFVRALEHLRAGHAWRDALDVEHRGADGVDGGVDGEGVLESWGSNPGGIAPRPGRERLLSLSVTGRCPRAPPSGPRWCRDTA